MKKKIVAVELNIFNEKVKQKVLNAGGKDIFPSSIGISTVLEMTQKRLRKQQWDVYGYNLADDIHQATRVWEGYKSILLLTFSKLVTHNVKGLQLHMNKEDLEVVLQGEGLPAGTLKGIPQLCCEQLLI